MSAEAARTGAEKRQAVRHEMVNFVWFHLLGKDGGPTQIESVGKMVDLSESGVGILVMNSELVTGNRIFVSITTPATTLCVTGLVAFTRGAENNYSRVGVQFEVVPPQHRLYLKALGSQDAKGKPR